MTRLSCGAGRGLAQPPHIVEAHDGTLWVCSWRLKGGRGSGCSALRIPWGNEPPSRPTRRTRPSRSHAAEGDDHALQPTSGRGAARGARRGGDQAASGPVDDVALASRPAGRGRGRRCHQSGDRPRPHLHVRPAGTLRDRRCGRSGPAAGPDRARRASSSARARAAGPAGA